MQTFAIGLHHTQGDALGYVLVAPTGRALNACYPMAVNMPSSRCTLKGHRRSRHVLKWQHAFKACPKMATCVQGAH